MRNAIFSLLPLISSVCAFSPNFPSAALPQHLSTASSTTAARPLQCQQQRFSSSQLYGSSNENNEPLHQEFTALVAGTLLSLSVALTPLPTEAATTASTPVAPPKPTDPVTIAKDSYATVSKQEAEIRKVVNTKQAVVSSAEKSYASAIQANSRSVQTLTEIQKRGDTDPVKLANAKTSAREASKTLDAASKNQKALVKDLQASQAQLDKAVAEKSKAGIKLDVEKAKQKAAAEKMAAEKRKQADKLKQDQAIAKEKAAKARKEAEIKQKADDKKKAAEQKKAKKAAEKAKKKEQKRMKAEQKKAKKVAAKAKKQEKAKRKAAKKQAAKVAKQTQQKVKKLEKEIKSLKGEKNTNEAAMTKLAKLKGELNALK